MLRPARLAALVAAVLTTAAIAAAPASAGTTAITISGCTLNASSTGTPPANVVVSPTSGSCTVSGITGTARTSGNTTLTTQPAMISDELRRQADHFIDLVSLKAEIGRDPSERAPRRQDDDLDEGY